MKDKEWQNWQSYQTSFLYKSDRLEKQKPPFNLEDNHQRQQRVHNIRKQQKSRGCLKLTIILILDMIVSTLIYKML